MADSHGTSSSSTSSAPPPRAPGAACRRHEWVDLDTPASACRGQTDHTGRPLELVFSDEFNLPGRTFRDGEDPVWTALANFPATQLQINAYDDSAEFATTAEGKLRLRASNVESRQRFVNSTDGTVRDMSRPYTSAMLQTWNKFCFSEGVIEISAKLPGDAEQPGLWPAFWLMGNLGRATVQESTDFMWPYSYAQCPADQQASANQNPREQQAINECLGENWTERFGLNPGQGRGAVEIDVVEAMPGSSRRDYKADKVDKGYCEALPEEEYRLLDVRQPAMYTNLILAPGIPQLADQRPNASCMPTDWHNQWYPELKPGTPETYGSELNTTVGDQWGNYFHKKGKHGRDISFQSDQISAASSLPREAFREQRVYRLEWRGGERGFLRFSMDGKFLYQINASMLQQDMAITEKGVPIGTLLGREMPAEPMYMILNIDLSTIWNWDDAGCKEQNCKCCLSCSDMSCWFCLVDGVNKREWLRKLCTSLPAYFEIDYVRIYQPEGETSTGCSPSSAPTEGWIEEHRSDYYAPYSYETLEPVYAGGAACDSWTQCGWDRGTCIVGACRCAPEWTGPHCLVRRTGAAAACAPLEALLAGGARCEHNSSASCGPHGDCVKVVLPWDSPKQDLVFPNGSLQAAGVRDGRCRCHAGWAGPHCRTEVGTRGPACVPDAGLRGPDLEAIVEAVCARTLLRDGLTASIREACAQVQWKPHWEEGGKYSRCGAWPRASLVVAAVHNDTGLCCSGLAQAHLDCQETGSGFVQLLGVASLVLLIMAFVGCLFQAHLRGGLCPERAGRGRSCSRCVRKRHSREKGSSSDSDDAEDLEGELSSEET